MTEKQTSEALEKLNQGIEESKRMVQERTVKLAQDYFGDSVQEIKQQIQAHREALEDLPDQVPGGQEESFRMLFQELMDNYARIEDALDEAGENVAAIDAEQLKEQVEIDASDAARREARELGVDLSEIEGTGSEGRIVVDDVKAAAEQAAESAGETAEETVEEATEEIKASDAARRKAEELGVDLSEIEGTGAGGLITVRDVTNLAGDVAGKATDAAEQTAGQADGAVEDAADKVGQVAGTNGDGPQVTNAAKRKAEELGVDLSQVEGTGVGGLITIKDVMNA